MFKILRLKFINFEFSHYKLCKLYTIRFKTLYSKFINFKLLHYKLYTVFKTLNYRIINFLLLR
jgi:hypothetical protein